MNGKIAIYSILIITALVLVAIFLIDSKDVNVELTSIQENLNKQSSDTDNFVVQPRLAESSPLGACLTKNFAIVGFENLQHIALRRSLGRLKDKLDSAEKHRYFDREIEKYKMRPFPNASTMQITRENIDNIDNIPAPTPATKSSIDALIQAKQFSKIELEVSKDPTSLYYTMQFHQVLPSELLVRYIHEYGYGDLNILRLAVMLNMDSQLIDQIIASFPNYQEQWNGFFGAENLLTLSVWANNINLTKYWLNLDFDVQGTQDLSLEDILVNKRKSLKKDELFSTIKLLSQNGYQWSLGGYSTLESYIGGENESQDVDTGILIKNEIENIVEINKKWGRYVVEKDLACLHVNDEREYLTDALLKDWITELEADSQDNTAIEAQLSSKSKFYVEIYRLGDSDPGSYSEFESKTNRVLDKLNTALLESNWNRVNSLLAENSEHQLKRLMLTNLILMGADLNRLETEIVTFAKEDSYFVLSLISLNRNDALQLLRQNQVQIEVFDDFGKNGLYFAVMGQAIDTFGTLAELELFDFNDSYGFNPYEFMLLEGATLPAEQTALLKNQYGITKNLRFKHSARP